MRLLSLQWHALCEVDFSWVVATLVLLAIGIAWTLPYGQAGLFTLRRCYISFAFSLWHLPSLNGELLIGLFGRNGENSRSESMVKSACQSAPGLLRLSWSLSIYPPPNIIYLFLFIISFIAWVSVSFCFCIDRKEHTKTGFISILKMVCISQWIREHKVHKRWVEKNGNNSNTDGLPPFF